MKNMAKVLSIMSIISLLFTGCGTNVSSVKVTENQNLIVVLGNHMHNYVPDTSLCEESLRSACMEEGMVGVIVSGGTPYLASGKSIPIPKQESGLSNAKIKQIVNSEVEQIEMLMSTSMAEGEEVDLLSALELASREANSDKYTGKTDVYIFDSGVSTKVFDMSLLNIENVDVQKVVQALQEKNMIPDFSNMGVIQWYSCGDTDYKLSRNKSEKIKELWETIITAGGGNVVFHSDTATETFDEDLPYVTKIPNTIEFIIEPEDVEGEKSVQTSYEEPVVFPECSVGFNPGETTFLDEVVAKDSLEDVASFLLSNPDKKMLVAATTAMAGSQPYRLDLSQRRADKVKDLLISMGVNSSQIETIGLGADSGFYVPDQDEAGNLIEEEAVKNRTIVCMDIESEIAGRILSGDFPRSDYNV